MELNMARDVNGNKKSFCKYSSSRRKTVENVSTMLNKTGDLITWDGEKVLEDFFALVFTTQAGLREPQVPQRLGGKAGTRLTLGLCAPSSNHNPELWLPPSPCAAGAPLDAATPVPREPPAAVRGVTRDTGKFAGAGTAWQCRDKGWGGCFYREMPLRLPFLSFSFSCFLKKGPDAFTLAGLPWPAARGGTRNAMCECISVCAQY